MTIHPVLLSKTHIPVANVAMPTRAVIAAMPIARVLTFDSV